MSNYGRRAPNLASMIDLDNVETPVVEDFGLDSELALFTNTEFYDFDSGQQADFQAQPTKPQAGTQNGNAAAAETPAAMGEMGNMDFSQMTGDFAFTDFNPYPAFNEGHQGYQPTNHPSVYSTPSATSPNQPFPQHAATPIDARKASVSTPAAGRPLNMEDASRHAAEEDKRRRNTAASARFRVKKKQREQALEKSAKEMNEKVSGLESKVAQLETENKWLKNLLVEKNEGNNEIANLWREFTKHASAKAKAANASS